jgi:hypothetical protein
VFIREDFSNRLAQTGLFELVPRTEVDKLFKQEASFQLNDLSDASKTAEYGRVLNADWIMAGRLGKVGSRLALVVTMYTYPDFVQKPGSQVYAPDIDTLVDNLPTMIATIQAGAGGATAPAATNPAPSPAKPAASKTYKIGDTGPAGGIVFYDKGNTTGGWRYLEAAPASTEGTNLTWAVNDGKPGGTKDGIGAGKQNTQAIVDYSLRTGENMPAARYCDRLNYGGYDDWFLPSKLELGLMFLNLKDAGIGGFNGEWYWSSSESSNYGSPVWVQRFSDGFQAAEHFSPSGSRGSGRRNNAYSVRAVRAF